MNDLIKSAIRDIMANRLRSFLTVLGIVIGIASVITMVSVGESTKATVNMEISDLGSDVIFILPGEDEEEAGFFGGGLSMMGTWFTLEDYENLKYKDSLYIDKVSLRSMSNAELRYRDEPISVSLWAVDDAFFEVIDVPLDQGRALLEEDAGERHIMISPRVKEKLFGEADVIGRRVELNGEEFKIVGVEGEGSGSQFDFSSSMNVVYIHYQSLSIVDNNELRIGALYMAPIDSESTDLAVADTEKILRASRGLGRDQKSDFTIETQKGFLEMTESILGMITTFVSLIAAVSLLVGGIGIMNVMLISVRERVKEIGLRKAVGATDQDILYQFLAEAVILTFIGAVIGLILGGVGGYVTSKLSNFTFVMPLYILVIAVVVSGLLGIVFGLYPAWQASRLSPIEALRDE